MRRPGPFSPVRRLSRSGTWSSGEDVYALRTDAVEGKGLAFGGPTLGDFRLKLVDCNMSWRLAWSRLLLQRTALLG
jgi:hypothetical protein